VNRITKYCASKFDGKVPDAGQSGEAEAWMISELETRLPQLVQHYENMDFRKVAAETRAIWAAGNEYLTKAEPWVKYKSSVDDAAVGVRTGLNLAALFGIVAQPIIPEAAKMILDAIGIPEKNRTMNAEGLGDVAGLIDALPHGHAISPPDVLFRKIEDDQVAEWSEAFGGEV
jgi:methionyl-tRNA synthetase